jgi:hypothetical protein
MRFFANQLGWSVVRFGISWVVGFASRGVVGVQMLPLQPSVRCSETCRLRIGNGHGSIAARQARLSQVCGSRFAWWRKVTRVTARDRPDQRQQQGVGLSSLLHPFGSAAGVGPLERAGLNSQHHR